MALIYSYFVDISVHGKLLHSSASRTHVTIYDVQKCQQNTRESMPMCKLQWLKYLFIIWHKCKIGLTKNIKKDNYPFTIPYFVQLSPSASANLNAPRRRREDRSGGLGPSKAAILEMLTTIRIAIYRIKFRLNLSL